MRMAERALARRADRKRAASTPGAPESAAAPDPAAGLREARLSAKARLARGGPLVRVLQGVTVLMDIDLLLFGRIRSGPFFARLEKALTPCGSSTPPSIRSCRARSAARRTSRRSPKASPPSATRSTSPSAPATPIDVGSHSRCPRCRPDAAGSATWHDVGTPLGSPNLRLLRRGRLRALATALRPDVVIERYHNFGGEGLLAARAVGARTVLEVNAPVVDYPGSPKRTVDRLLVAEPMRRWREWQCRAADLIVTTDRAILPPDTPAAKVIETEWGADTVRFHPGAVGPVPFARQPGELIAVFAGAFRAWHGVGRLVDAMAALERRGSPWRAVLIGDGPERAGLEARVAAERLTRVAFTGSLPYDAMPAALAAADVGVAPFDPDAHAPLRHGFYWSPLKVFEYMASGLPVVAPALPRLRAILGGPGARARRACSTTAPRPVRSPPRSTRWPTPIARRRLGAAARARAEQHFSWAAHCRTLDAAIAAMRATTRARGMTMAASRHVLLVTDAFPPVSGGSGWSTYELARGLRAHGDRVTVLRPRPGTPAGLRVVADAFDGFDVHELGGPSPPIPFVRNYVKNERLARRLAPVVRDLVRERAHRRRARPAPAVDPGRHRRRARRRCPGRRHHPRLLAGLLLVGSDPRSIERDAVPGVLGRDDDALRARRTPARPGRRRCRPSPTCAPTCGGRPDAWPRPTPSSPSAR